jgi:hypothetical protein
MVWSLLLAHFIADFPLQSNWMVKAKRDIRILLLHVSIHLAVMVIVVGAARTATWPYLLFLAVLHFGIDYVKNEINEWKPTWVVVPYIVDQVIHYLTIVWVAVLIRNNVLDTTLSMNNIGFIYATGFLVVTYVWFITERILFYSDNQYRQEIIAQFWSRMAVRALLLSVFLWGSNQIPSIAAITGVVTPLPYLSGKYPLRALFTDLIVATVVLIFIRLAI